MKPKVKVKFNNVSKKYNLYRKQSDKLFDIFLSKKRSKSFYALRDISFEVYEGETVGVIGINGSGKSTLSNLLAQVVPPTSGTIEINGETSLIAISVGLNNNLTGIENIELKCLMLGLKKEQLKEIAPKIIEFADIGEFIYQPVKNYSSGMKSRLGFAISVHTNPDILIVDEALSVGDETFYEKCLNKINEFKADGKTIFFISHSISQVRSMSDRILWLNYGKIEEFDRVRPVIEKYKDFIKWFNSLDENEKKKYKIQKLDEQLSGQKNNRSVNDLQKYQSRKSIHKDHRKKNPLVYLQLIFLTLCTILSLIVMFVGNPLLYLSENMITYKKSSENLNQLNTNEMNAIKTINKNGRVIAERAKLYEDIEKRNVVNELDFASPIYIEKQIDGLLKVNFDNISGYIEKNNVVDLETPIVETDMTIDEFSEVFPENFKASYEYYLAQLDLSYKEIITKLMGLSNESVDSTGNKLLDYKYDNVSIFVDKDQGKATKIIINNIEPTNLILDKVTKNAQIKSKDENLFLIRIKGYDLIFNSNNETLQIVLN